MSQAGETSSDPTISADTSHLCLPLQVHPITTAQPPARLPPPRLPTTTSSSHGALTEALFLNVWSRAHQGPGPRWTLTGLQHCGISISLGAPIYHCTILSVDVTLSCVVPFVHSRSYRPIRVHLIPNYYLAGDPLELPQGNDVHFGN